MNIHSMENKKPIPHTIAGLLIAGFIVVFAILTQFLGLANQTWVGLLQYLIIIISLIFFVRQYGKANHYALSFGNLFAYGFKSTAVFTIIFIGFLILFFLLFPDLKEKTFETARIQMEKNEKLSDEQINQAIEMTRKFFWVGVVGGSMIFLIIFGAIGSLIGAAITKKRPQNIFDQPNA